MSFQGRLKELREAANLTQDELADRAGMSRAGITQLEIGRRNPSWETLQKLAVALGVTIEAFAEGGGADDTPPKRGRPRKPAPDAAAVPAAAEGAKGGGKSERKGKTKGGTP